MPSIVNDYRVAIIGGGIAGASLANALVKIDRVQFEIYESGAEFSERGAAVGLAANAQRALDRVTPSAEALLTRASAVAMASSRLQLGSGSEAGTTLFDINSGGKVVHRAALLRELLAPLPREHLHVNKKLVGIDERDDVVHLTFADGTHATFEAVIGADGIFSTVRDYVVNDTNEKHKAKPAGFWDCRNLVPLQTAKDALGEEYFEQHRQYGWIGDGGFIMHDVLDKGEQVQCVMSAFEENPTDERKRPLTKEYLEKKFGKWLDGPIANGMIELILNQEDPSMWSQWEHRSTPTYARGRVCIMGDAAHAMTPWQGSGAGQAVEDAMIIGELLASVTESSQIKAAFTAYDAVRRPRAERVVDSSRGSGIFMCGSDPVAGLDANRIRELLPPRWGFILQIDTQSHIEEALAKFRDLTAWTSVSSVTN